MKEFRGRGYAQQAIQLAEEVHGSSGWALDTILQEKGNCYLYEKMGYRQTGEAKALNIAYSAHQGQIDKGGIPYIQHLIRVALNCLTDDEKIVALLHDVVEDTSVTVEELINEGFNQNIIDAIISLTKKWGRLYDVYSTCILERTCNISKNPRS